RAMGRGSERRPHRARQRRRARLGISDRPAEAFLTETSGFRKLARTYDSAMGDTKEIAATLLKLGATSYGGPAIMGVMQAELQQKRQWVSKERFLEGLAVANMVPGATATQLGIFL